MVSFLCSSKISEALLASLHFAALSVVIPWKIAAAVVGIASICDEQIAGASKSRPARLMAIDQILLALGHEFFSHVERQQKGFLASIVQPVIFDCVPLVMREACDGSAELCSDEGEGVLDVVADTVEGGGIEFVLRCSEYPFQFHRSAKAAPQELEVLSVPFSCLG
jgi:hypothetical protein